MISAFSGFKAALEERSARSDGPLILSAITNPHFEQNLEKDRALFYAA